ncbi:transposable element Tc1 transposase [Trichonephila clavipes]|nr:transposable element Tc1 transposase [Trichonephila clavipes]
MRVWKRGTDEHRTARKTGRGRRKVTSANGDRHLLRMAVNDRTASTRQIPLTANHRRLRLQLAHEHRACQADWHKVVFSDESRFNLWDHDGRIRVRRYAGERCLPESGVERHNGLTPGATVWGAISYHGRSNLLRIKGIPGTIFQQDNARPHVAKTFRDFCSAQHMQLLPWAAYSPDTSPIEHVWDLFSRLLARDPRSAAFSYTSRHSKSVRLHATEIGSRIGRNQTTVVRICDRWMQEGTTDRRGRLHPSQCTTSREDRQTVRMAVTDHSVTLQTVAQHIESNTSFSVCAYHSTQFTVEWSVRKTSIACLPLM